MLESLTIKNFRLFDEFLLKRLSTVNLFVGKNSSGKSALLEALQVWASNAAPEVLNQLVLARDGYWESELEEQVGSPTIENPWRSLFRGYHLPEIGAEGIEIGPTTRQTLRIQTTAYQLIQEPDAVRRVAVDPSALGASNLENVQYGLEARENGSSWQLAPLRVEPRYFRRTAGRAAREPKCTVQSVPSHTIPPERVALLWDKIHLTDSESLVTDCLKLVHGNLAGVALVGEPGRFRAVRIPIARLKDSSERIPLKALGDGMTRLFAIVLSLVNARDGILLIDEFENGLHWSVQPHVWKLLFTVAKDLNVRIFATTHSQDCVRAFHSVWKTHEPRASFYRLDKNGSSSPRPTAYDCETLSDAIETEVEVR